MVCVYLFAFCLFNLLVLSVVRVAICLCRVAHSSLCLYVSLCVHCVGFCCVVMKLLSYLVCGALPIGLSAL